MVRRQSLLLIATAATAGLVLTPVGADAKLDASQVFADAGEYHTCAVTTAGAVKCWGWNRYGQLGDGTRHGRKRPVGVVGLSSGVIAIAAGIYHTCALTDSGAVKCWGDNTSGQLGDGTMHSRSSPVGVVGLSSGVIAIAAGGFHTCAVTATGAVKCWGANWVGQLGDGTTKSRKRPIDAVGLSSGVSAITAGVVHTCAVTTAGAVKCWASNRYGQLGDGTHQDRTRPAQVVGLSSGVSAITAGGYHTCAVTDSGAVKCWGWNGFGGLGDGTTHDRRLPVNLVGLSSAVTAITAGRAHTCALTHANAVACWGSNEYGQLGDGTQEGVTQPVYVKLYDEVTGITAGYGHTCAVTVAGAVKCWGMNEYGQLGDGTKETRLHPVSVVGFGGS